MFNEKIILLDSSKPREYFPERFSNEIYHSKVDSFEGEAYKSSYSIKLCLSGVEEYEIDGQRRTLRKGEYLIVNNGSIVKSYVGVPSEGICFYLDNEIVAEAHANLFKSLEYRIDNPSTAELSIPFFEITYSEKDEFGIYLNELIHNFLLKEKKDNVQIKPEMYFSLANKLVSKQFKTNEKISSLNRVKKQTKEEVFRRVNLAINHINQNISNKFDLDELSKASYLSKYYLIRSFKEVTNKTPFEYYHQQRMEFARKLILKKSCSLNEIASTTNFNDLSAFSNAFKAYYGVAPSMYSK